jgi:hypothetical protein
VGLFKPGPDYPFGKSVWRSRNRTWCTLPFRVNECEHPQRLAESAIFYLKMVVIMSRAMFVPVLLTIIYAKDVVTRPLPAIPDSAFFYSPRTRNLVFRQVKRVKSRFPLLSVAKSGKFDTGTIR